MARTLIRQLILGDIELAALGVVPAGVLSGDIDTPQVRPFLQLRWGTTQPGLSTVNFRLLTIWVHDEPGDYAPYIDPIAFRLRNLLPAQYALAHETGWLTSVEWSGDGDDGSDDGHGTIFRTTSYTLVGSGF